jgi:hypothetical protein
MKCSMCRRPVTPILLQHWPHICTLSKLTVLAQPPPTPILLFVLKTSSLHFPSSNLFRHVSFPKSHPGCSSEQKQSKHKERLQTERIQSPIAIQTVRNYSQTFLSPRVIRGWLAVPKRGFLVFSGRKFELVWKVCDDEVSILRWTSSSKRWPFVVNRYHDWLEVRPCLNRNPFEPALVMGFCNSGLLFPCRCPSRLP